MRVEKIEFRILSVKPDELARLADRMEMSFNQCGKFTEDIMFDDKFHLEIAMKSETNRRTRLEAKENKFILKTNPGELRKVAAKIRDLQKNSEVGSNMTVAEYVTLDAVLKVVAEQE